MRDHGPTQRLGNFPAWQNLSGYGAGLMHWASRGFGLKSPQNLAIAGLGTKLSVLKPGDPAVAQDMARGIFSLAGATVTGRPIEVFDAAPPLAAWKTALQNLSWLKHFLPADLELNRIVARTLVLKWGAQRSHARAPGICFQALLALSSAAHFLVGPAPSSFDAPFYALVEKLIRRVLELHPATPDDRLWQAIALQYASLAFHGSAALLDQANAKLCAVINQVILPDGGHVSRNPQALLELLIHIVPLKNAMTAAHEAVPQALNAAIERMFPMLRMLSHGDRSFGNFQGAGMTDMNCIKALLEHDTSVGRPLLAAPHSGYCRLAHKSGLLIMDTGVPVECNSPLAFEFSDGPHRILSNCGMPCSASPEWRKAAADIAAHNTLEVASFESNAQNSLQAEVVASPQGSVINCINQISGKSGRVSHHRNIFLSHAGDDLRGEDRVVPLVSGNTAAPPLDFTIRFHLHPAVKASFTRKGTRLVIMLANRAAWQFIARGGAMSLEDSVFLGDALGPRKSQQIVIRGSTDGSMPVNWALRRVEKPSVARQEMAEIPQLPF